MALAPITIISRARNVRNDRQEIWEAMTADGEWGFERLEEMDTPWIVVFMPTGTEVARFGSLPKCRQAVETGWAQKELASILLRRKGLNILTELEKFHVAAVS